MPRSEERQEILRRFEERGFVVIQNALSTREVSVLNRAVDRYWEEHRGQWTVFDESLIHTANVLPSMSEFDFTIENSATLDILRGVIGEEITFEEFEIMIRQPTNRTSDLKGWHRDLFRDFSRRKEIDYYSAVYYLTDVSPEDHCFSIVPESHDRLIDLRPEEIPSNGGFDVIGPAGTATLFHGRCIHRGKLKPNSRQRRTLHIYYARRDQPRTSEWSDIPPRLYQKVDPDLPRWLYSKWNVTEVYEGTGKKPRDVDPSMPAADMLRVVQERANKNPIREAKP